MKLLYKIRFWKRKRQEKEILNGITLLEFIELKKKRNAKR